MIVFIVAGRLGENLIYYKSLPVANIAEITKVIVFCEKPLLPFPKIQYITLPEIIFKLRPKFFKVTFSLIFEPLQILWYAIKHKPQVINGVYTLPKGLNSSIVSWLTGTKCVISVLGGKEEIEPKFFPRNFWFGLNRLLVRRADAITTKGFKDSQYISSLIINPAKIFIYNGFIDTVRFYPGSGIRNIDIVFVGKFYELKGTDRILQVFEVLKDVIPEFKAAMIGTGADLGKTISRAESMGLKNNIEFTGFIKNTEDYYKKAKILILMSRSEGMPNCMLEAMASGCVPVVPDVGNITEFAIHKFNSIVVDDYDDITTFSKNILLLLERSDLRETLAINARKSVIDKFSLEAQSNAFRKIIKYLNIN
jgi:glycosyltransferase involved in cell wall biosynthesis